MQATHNDAIGHSLDGIRGYDSPMLTGLSFAPRSMAETHLTQRDVEMRNTIEMLFASGITNGRGLEWVKACCSPAEGGFDVYSDPATVRRDGDMVKMWHLHDFKIAQVLAGKTYLSAKNWVEYDCKNQRRRTLYLSLSSENLGVGDAVYRQDTPSDWKPVTAGSIAEVLWKLACGKL